MQCKHLVLRCIIKEILQDPVKYVSGIINNTITAIQLTMFSKVLKIFTSVKVKSNSSIFT